MADAEQNAKMGGPAEGALAPKKMKNKVGGRSGEESEGAPKGRSMAAMAAKVIANKVAEIRPFLFSLIVDSFKFLFFLRNI